MAETLDIEQPEALLAYLRHSRRIADGERPVMRVLAGGVSNRTVLVERPAGEAWVVKQALEKLRVPVDWFSSPRRIEREAEGLRWLVRLAPPGTITPLVFEDRAEHLLAMQAVPLPHENWKTLLLGGELERRHVELFGLLLGTIHAQAWRRRGELAHIFDDQSFFESLRVEPYYSYTRAQIPAAADFLESLIAETRACRLTLTHGDYSPKNILVYRGRLVLLDHEVIHWGDPAFDLGFSLAHMLSKAHHVRRRRDEFAAAAIRYWEVYRATAGGLDWLAAMEARAARHTLACLLARVAGRSQLEYLDDERRARQRQAVLALLESAPTTVTGLVHQFIAQLENYADDQTFGRDASARQPGPPDGAGNV